jgi:hypothetical protein
MITERNDQMCKRSCHNHKTCTSDNWKHERDKVRHIVPSSEQYAFEEHTKKPKIRNAWFQQWNTTRGDSVTVWTAISCYSVGPMITLQGRIIGRTAGFGRWISVAQWSDASRLAWHWWACAVTLFCLSNNSDVVVIGSLLLVHCVFLSHMPFVCFSLSLVSLCRRDKSVA